MRRVITGLCTGALVLPVAAGSSFASTGGTRAQGGHHTGSTGATGTLAGTGGALDVTPASVVAGALAVASGDMPSADAGRTARLQVQVQAGISWSTVARGPVGPTGAFVIAWRPRRTGELTLRAVSAGPGSKVASTAASPATATSDTTLSVYRQVVATWYGPGLYGQRTACGETLSRSIVGVAHRTLPCGTPVSLTLAGRTLVLPVIDRGPFGTAATLDLTHAAAEELGITKTTSIGMMVLAGPLRSPTNWYPPGSSPTGAVGTTGAKRPGTTAGGATAPAG